MDSLLLIISIISFSYLDQKSAKSARKKEAERNPILFFPRAHIFYAGKQVGNGHHTWPVTCKNCGNLFYAIFKKSKSWASKNMLRLKVENKSGENFCTGIPCPMMGRVLKSIPQSSFAIRRHHRKVGISLEVVSVQFFYTFQDRTWIPSSSRYRIIPS